MKLLGAVVGFAVIWALFRFFPDKLAAVPLTAGAGAVLAGIAMTLTAPWAVALTRLSVFEKLDDLTSKQQDIAIGRARSMRRFIIQSIFVNALTAIACALGLFFSANSAPVLYLVAASFCVWLVGFFQAYRCWVAADESRLSLLAAQANERKRKKYLDALVEADRKNPVNRQDPHLNGYSR